MQGPNVKSAVTQGSYVLQYRTRRFLSRCSWSIHRALFRARSSSKFDPSQVRSIIICHTGALGDSILTLPVAQELRRLFPDAKLTVLVKFVDNGPLEDD